MENSSPSGEVAIGSIVAESYKITGMLGQGGMGTVWAAQHLRLPKQVAIKVLLGAVAGNPDIFARFRREAEIASRLGHANIVDVLDFNVFENGTPYLVLELLKGESLGARIAKGPLSVDSTLSIVRQIASGLLAAHKQQVVHRDLKPENVFLCPREIDGEIRDHVKVLDFGISKIRGSNTVQTQTSTVLGTPQYMAPEQAAGKHDLVDGRTDQFALAAMVCEMFTGEPVFAGETIAEVVFKVVYEPLPPLEQMLPGIPKSIRDALERALSKEPDQRFADMSEFIHALSGRSLATTEQTSEHAAEAVAATIGSGQHTPAAIAATMASGAHSPGASASRSPMGTASTMASGAHSPSVAAPATTNASAQSAVNKKMLWIAVGILMASGAATTLLMVGRDDGGQPLAMADNADPTITGRGVISVAPDAATVAVPAVDAAAAVRQPPDAKPKRVTVRPPPDEKVPAAVAADVAAARGAIKAKDWRAAISAAKRVTRARGKARRLGYGLLFVAECGRKNLGAINSVTPKLRGLTRGKKRNLLRRCKRLFPSYDGGL